MTAVIPDSRELRATTADNEGIGRLVAMLRQPARALVRVNATRKRARNASSTRPRRTQQPSPGAAMSFSTSSHGHGFIQ